MTKTKTDRVCVGLVRGDNMLVVHTWCYPDNWRPIGGRCVERENPKMAATRDC